MKKLCTFILLVLSSMLYAQNETVTGYVEDNTGIPIPGATILVKGTSRGAVTDFDGNFKIAVPTPVESKAIQISFLGYETQVITIGKKRDFQIILQPNTEDLDEIVVIGYGTVKKSDLTGSVSSVKSEDIVVAGAIGIDQALAGRAPGVVVTQNSGEPGVGASIRIRAVSSLNGSEPLYVIDGIPMDNTTAESLHSDFEDTQMSPLSLVDPSDVESIEILKDASSTAIYGSRGANGVILITTKKGKKGKGVVSVVQEYGITEVFNYMNLLDANEFTIINSEATVNNGGVPGNLINLIQAQQGQLEGTDWQRSSLQLGSNTNTNVTFSGGNDGIRYLLSTNMLNTKGILPNSDYQRIGTRLNLTADVTEKLKVSARFNYTHNTSTQTNANAFRRALRVSPLSGLNEDDPEELDPGEEVLLTPRLQANSLEVNNFNTQFIGSLTAEYSFNDALSAKTVVTNQNRNDGQRYYQQNTLPENAAAGGQARTRDTRTTRTTITNTVNFNKTYGNHSVNAILGQSLEAFEKETIRVQNFGFPNDLLTYFAPETATFFDPDQVTYIDNRLSSFFGRINYSINNKYLFTLTGRYDGSSKFAVNNKWAFFPAAAFAYKLSEEKFIEEIDAISEMKLRVSYGTSGNQAIGSYRSLDQYESSFTAFNEQSTAVYFQNQIPSPNLTWETTTQLDVGLDLGFLKNKLSITFDYYNKITDDLLFSDIDIPVHSGQETKTENFGKLETNGIELAINARVINKSKFSWTIVGNLSTGKTVVNELGADFLDSGWDPGFISGGTQRLIIGEEIGSFFGYKRTGITQFDDFVEFQGVSEEDRINIYNANPTGEYTFVDGFNRGYPGFLNRQRLGEQLYEDINGDGVITADDRQIIGQAQADIILSINNSFSIGNFDFSFFLDSQLNKDLVSMQNYNGLNFAGTQALDVVLNRWRPENQNNTWPRVLVGSAGANLFSDRYIEDGSFVRLQNIMLGYNLPKKLTKKLNIRNLRIYGSVTNVAIWTNYTGFSPDVSLRGPSTTNLGHDNAGYPPTRLIRMGINLKF